MARKKRHDVTEDRNLVRLRWQKRHGTRKGHTGKKAWMECYTAKSDFFCYAIITASRLIAHEPKDSSTLALCKRCEPGPLRLWLFSRLSFVSRCVQATSPVSGRNWSKP